MSSVTVVILTLNEEVHIKRCIESAKKISSDIVVIDSFSSDATVAIAEQKGARVLQNAWPGNQALQFNWALDQLPRTTQWIMRIDADEYLTTELIDQINDRIPTVKSAVNGIFCKRSFGFQGHLLKHGGAHAIQVLRLFRFGFGCSEVRWMDEHIEVQGSCIEFSGELIDDNLRPLKDWTDKHNQYSSREAVELLAWEYPALLSKGIEKAAHQSQIGAKRWIKKNIYTKLPAGLRALAYFIYRYIFMLGFLDGKSGTHFHVLQAFWYRYLVDAKVDEVKRYMHAHHASINEAIKVVLGITV